MRCTGDFLSCFFFIINLPLSGDVDFAFRAKDGRAVLFMLC